LLVVRAPNVRALALRSLLVASLIGLVPYSATEAGSKKNDLDREGLKGPVKMVLIEIEKLSKEQKSPREHSRIPWLSLGFDRMGNRVEERQLYVQPVLSFRSVFARDSLGRLTGGAEYNHEGGIEFRWDYSYDPTGKRIEENRYSANDDSFFSRSTYLYDEDGNLVEETRLHAESSNDFRWVYSYDEKGNRVAEEFYLERLHDSSTGKRSLLDSKTVWRYSSKGDPVEEIRYDASGSVKSTRRYAYEYDPQGNWIKQFARVSASSGEPPSEPSEVTYRTITYY
jgi:hypothetical protein